MIIFWLHDTRLFVLFGYWWESAFYLHKWKNDFQSMMMIKTVRAIEPDEELTINYNGNWNDDKKLWFDAR